MILLKVNVLTESKAQRRIFINPMLIKTIRECETDDNVRIDMVDGGCHYTPETIDSLVTRISAIEFKVGGVNWAGGPK